MEVNLEIFADNLKHLMEQKGFQPYDYTALADQLEIEPPRVKRWLDGVCFPKHEIMVKLMKLFGITDYNKFLTTRLQPIGVKTR
jgi:ribosome-binding protein aMBF1 (putative translation factor)